MNMNQHIVALFVLFGGISFAANGPAPSFVAPTESVVTLDLLHHNFTAPADSPLPPGDYFAPVFSGAFSPGNPEIADYTRQAGVNDLFVIQGKNFGAAPKVWIFQQTDAADGATIQSTLAQSLPETLTATMRSTGNYGLGLVWVENAGKFSRPIRINAAELWWNDRPNVNRGGSLSLFGRNLSFRNGTTTSYVYMRPWGASSGIPSTPCTVTSVNPYRVDLMIPSSFSDNTDYEVWLHNGHGGQYGWAGPLKVRVGGGSYGWTGVVRNVPTGGDIAAALNAALPGDTVQLAAGTYAISSPITVKAGVQLLGAGKSLTTIQAAPTFNSGSQKCMIRMIAGRTRVSALKVDTNGSLENLSQGLIACSGYGIDPIPTGNYIDKVSFVDASGREDIVCIYMGWCSVCDISQCDFTAHRGLFLTKCSRVNIWINSFIGNSTGASDLGGLISVWSSTELCINGNTFSSLDRANGRVARRSIIFQNPYGPSINCYLAKNNSNGVGPHLSAGPGFQNTGETYMFETANSLHYASPIATSPTTATFSGVSWTNSEFITGDLPGWSQQSNAAIVLVSSGPGAGQWRRIIGNTNNQITVDRPWDVIPGSNDTVCVLKGAARDVFYSNSIYFSPDENSNGINDNYEFVRASAGIQLWGSAVECDLVKNTVSGNRYGFVFAGYYSAASGVFSPQTNILVANNDANNALNANYEGIFLAPYVSANGSGPFSGGPVTRNIVIRRNKINLPKDAGILIEKMSPYYTWNWGWVENSVLDSNSFTNIIPPAVEMVEDPYASDTVAR